MNAHVEAPRREHPLARLTRAVEGTIPNPLLALPPLLLALGLLVDRARPHRLRHVVRAGRGP